MRWKTFAAVVAAVAVAVGPLGGYKVAIRAVLRTMAEPPRRPPPAGIAVQRDLPFGDARHGLTLDLFTADAAAAAAATVTAAPRPVLVFLFGGSWLAGNKHQHQLFDVAELLCRRGFALVAPDYRLSASLLGTPLHPFPAPIHDAKAAVRWIRDNAAAYNLDPGAIGVWGVSAGAHLAALLGTTSGVAALDGPHSSSEATSSSVQAVVDYFGPAHIPHLAAQNPAIAWILEDLMGGPIAGARRARAELGSPLLHVTADAAPFLIVHGEDDPIVPVQQSEALHAALEAAGVDSTMVVLPGAGHGTPEEMFTSQEEKDRVVAFLERHLKRETAGAARL